MKNKIKFLYYRLKSLIANNLRAKLILAFVLIIIIFEMLHITNYIIAGRVIRKNAITYADLLAENMSKSIDNVVYEMDRLTQNLLLDEKLLNGLNESTSENTLKSAANYSNILEAINNILNARLDIDGVMISNINGKIVTGGPNAYNTVSNNISIEKWYQEFMKSDSIFCVLPPHKTNAHKVISVLRKLRAFSDLKVCGLVRIDMKASLLDEICNENKLKDNSVVIFYNNEMVYSSGRKLDKGDISYIGNKPVFSNESYLINSGSGKQYVSVVKSDYTNMNVAFVVPETVLLSDMKIVNNISIILGIIGSMIAVLMAIISSSTMKKSVDTVLEGMKSIEKGKLDTIVTVKSEDEIARIALGLNRMVKEMNILMEQNAQMEVKKKEAEMMMLQRQINPHFLYNTLDGIRMRAIINKDEEAAYMMEQLSLILRRTTDIKTEYVRFDDELDYVSRYIILQNLRFRYKFELYIDISNKVNDMIIPKFILQPLIENAVRYGLEAKKKNRCITIESIEEKENILVNISDNGVGIKPERLAEIRAALECKDGNDTHHIGLNNINSRLKLYYGEEYGLTIVSNEGEGTTVTLHFPKYKTLEVM